MNKVILMGRLTRDPEVRYTQNANGESLAITRFGIAVNKRFKREGEPDADFINCVAFGKTGEFTGKYFKKGMMISVVGRLSVNNWTDKEGQKRTTTEVVVEEQFFAESKSSFEARNGGVQSTSNDSVKPAQGSQPDDFYNVDSSVNDDDLPF
ncbi:MAG: single-stranded DNA-binding protein [Firmicutes bacterium]|nr:single-stranded DNA-binding protein [Bacillota bacterium]